MRKHWLFYFVFVLVLLTNASVFAVSHNYELNAQRTEILFDGKSTLHAFHGFTHEATASTGVDVEALEVEVPFLIQVPVSSLDTQNKKRDKAMRRMFQAEAYPHIIFKVETIKVKEKKEFETLVCEVTGKLNIRSIEQPIQFLTGIKLKGNQIHAQGSFKINIKDFKLKPPSVLGVIRVSKEIVVHFESLWKVEE